MAQKPLYRVIIQDASGSYVQMHRFSSLKYGYSLNHGTIAELSMPLSSTKLNNLTSAILNSWIRIYRWSDPTDQGTERLVWYGKLTDVSYSLDDTDGNIVMRYSDLQSLLAFRLVPQDYSVTTPTDASTILWNLINNTQLIQDSGGTVVGDLGITEGATPSSKNRTPEKDLQNRTILDAMIAFSEYEDGIDWEITPTPRNESIGIFNTYFAGAGQKYHKGNIIATPLIYHVDETGEMKYNNVVSVNVDESGSDYANDVLALGATIDETQLYSQAENEWPTISIWIISRCCITNKY